MGAHLPPSAVRATVSLPHPTLTKRYITIALLFADTFAQAETLLSSGIYWVLFGLIFRVAYEGWMDR